MRGTGFWTRVLTLITVKPHHDSSFAHSLLKLFLVVQGELGGNFESISSVVHGTFKILWVRNQQRKETFLKQLFFSLLAVHQQERK